MNQPIVLESKPKVVSAKPPKHIPAFKEPEKPPKKEEISEEEQLHNNARRFARLLVSEIMLYDEQKVSEGRRSNDLYDRLKEDIDRLRNY